MIYIRKRRLALGLTQQQVADAIGTSKPFVCMVESGKTVPTTDKLPALAAILRCEIGELFHDYDDGKEAG